MSQKSNSGHISRSCFFHSGQVRKITKNVIKKPKLTKRMIKLSYSTKKQNYIFP